MLNHISLAAFVIDGKDMIYKSNLNLLRCKGLGYEIRKNTAKIREFLFPAENYFFKFLT